MATWYGVQGLCRGLCRHSRATNQTWGSTWSYTAKDAKEASACFSSCARSEGLFFNFRVSQSRKDPKCLWLMSTSNAITVVVSEDIKRQTGCSPILGWCFYARDDIFSSSVDRKILHFDSSLQQWKIFVWVIEGVNVITATLVAVILRSGIIIAHHGNLYSPINPWNGMGSVYIFSWLTWHSAPPCFDLSPHTDKIQNPAVSVQLRCQCR